MDTRKEPLCLALDLKKKRIRIHRSTFRALHNPDYFRFLVNPKQKSIILETCSKDAAGSFGYVQTSIHRHSIEMYSKPLIQQFVLCAGLDKEMTIRLIGRQNREENAILFQLESLDPERMS